MVVLIFFLYYLLNSFLHVFKRNENDEYYFAALLILLIAFGFYSIFYMHADTIGTKHIIAGDYINEMLSPAFWVSLIYVSYAYSGWNASSYIIDDIKNPKKLTKNTAVGRSENRSNTTPRTHAVKIPQKQAECGA